MIWWNCGIDFSINVTSICHSLNLFSGQLRPSAMLNYRIPCYYTDVIMSPMASQITSLTIVYSIVYSGADQRKRESSASLAFVMGIHRLPVNSPHKGPVTRKMLPFDDVIMGIFHQFRYFPYHSHTWMFWCDICWDIRHMFQNWFTDHNQARTFCNVSDEQYPSISS